MKIISFLAVCLCLSLAMPVTAVVADEVVLVVDGATGDGKAHKFTMADIAALPPAGFSTSTPWHTGVQRFDGVELGELMRAVGAKGSMLHVRALNDYKSDIPVADFSLYHPVLAYKRNGAPMRVRDKGPLFILYPYDSNPALKTETYYIRSPWQVAGITIE